MEHPDITAAGLGGAILSPNEALDSPDAGRNMAGSFRIVEADSYAEVKALVESDVYWTGGVVRVLSPLGCHNRH